MTTDIPSKQNSSLNKATQEEAELFKKWYLWLQNNMPSHFFNEVSNEHIMLIVHNLMGLHLQDYFSQINLKSAAVVLCLDGPKADLRILKSYSEFGIKNYFCFVSKNPINDELGIPLRIALIYFTEALETVETPLSIERKEELKQLIKERNASLTDEEFENLMQGINRRFLDSWPLNRIALALDMFFRAQTRDNCQYEVFYDDNWEESANPSMHIVLAWRNTPKGKFLFRLAKTIFRNKLVMKRVNATYINPYSKQSTLIMALGLHGSDNQPAWKAADIPTFLRELVNLKYFRDFDTIDSNFVRPNLVDGNFGNLLRSMVIFTHQVLVHQDINIYTFEAVEEALCRHAELTVKLTEAFTYKFHHKDSDLKKYEDLHEEIKLDIQQLDTGQETNDKRRKNVLFQALNFIKYTLKTNFYRNNKSGFSFRLDPNYLEEVPYQRDLLFPEVPFAIFFVHGMHFFGFHIRFKDLSRGGLRTIFTEKVEQMIIERSNVFIECYNLAYTQHKKNKDIPEGGAKGVIFLRPYHDIIESETEIISQELRAAKLSQTDIEDKINSYKKGQYTEFLYQAQRSFIDSFLTLINYDENGIIRAKHVVDYYNKPEYIYLGPDELMHNSMIEWIAENAKFYFYRPGNCFITGKPALGINHKEYGVTSLGVNVYMIEVLKHLGIDPKKDTFTIKLTGGPDGDVAGNQIYNLYKHCPNTAKLLSLVDGSGTVFDPQGLDLKTLVGLFKEGKPIKDYPPELLSDGSFLLDKHTKKDASEFVQQTLCWEKEEGKLKERWVSGSEMNHRLRHTVHQTKTDIFIPAGGRPRTLNIENIQDFLDENGKPTSKAIVEGANLYLTQEAREALESQGVVIIKDSSANKCGVICSSFEVLCGLCLSEEEFKSEKNILVEEILEILSKKALSEASLLLNTHKETLYSLIEVSDWISEKINTFTDQLLEYLTEHELDRDPKNPLIQCFLRYTPKTLREKYQDRLLSKIPDDHIKAAIASSIASTLVYEKGLSWSPTLVDVLPLILKDPLFK
jgi:glutamate dehydrogenase